MSDLVLSVVVATKDNCQTLLRLLESLESQYLGVSQYQVVVADAQSTDDTHEVLRKACYRYELDYFRSRRPGLPAALNQAVEAAKGDRLLFLADDLLAPPSLLEAHVVAHKDAPHCVVRGPLVPLEGEEIPMLDHPPPAVRLFFTINNSSMSKIAILKVGGFAEDVEPELEDREIGWRLHRDGWLERFHREAYAYRRSSDADPLLDLKKQAVLLARTAVAHYSQHPDASVARATGIHPMERFNAWLTSGDAVYQVARGLRETRLGQVPWVQGLLDQRIFMHYYHRALTLELKGKDL